MDTGYKAGCKVAAVVALGGVVPSVVVGESLVVGFAVAAVAVGAPLVALQPVGVDSEGSLGVADSYYKQAVHSYEPY